MNVGVLGGTFDPVHNGHLAVAEEARNRLNLAEIILIPAGQPQLKGARLISTAEHRLQMLRLAIADRPHFKLSAMEVERAGPSYTIATISELRDSLNKEDELFFILGWDILAELPGWREPARLISLCRLVAVPRIGYNPPDLSSLEAAIPGISGQVIVLDEPKVNVSSSVIRERFARGLPVQQLVPASVAEYIRRHGLYQRAGGSD